MSLIEFEQVTKSFGDYSPVLEEVDLSIGAGEFAFLTGVSGAGKTTVLKLIYGILKPDSGSITYNFAMPKKRFRSLSRFRSNMGFIFQTPTLLENRSVEYNIALPLVIMKEKKRVIKEKTEAALEACAISGLRGKRVSMLSGGEKQLVSLARCIISNPSIILADEPTANLDRKMALLLLNILLKLNEEGTTIVISTHDLKLMETYEGRIMLVKDKQVNDYNLATINDV